VTFHDHFSRDAAGYARYRPHYPAALFEWLAATVETRELAWDCATGNGQAAVGLAERFMRVVATDASADQLRHATLRSNIEYRQAGAEASGLPTHSADLVTCAQAMHWLPRDAFFAEARRVLHPGSVIAVWGYHIPMVRDDEIDAAIRHFHDAVVGPYWPPERRLVLDRFATLEFPFSQFETPGFEMQCAWTLDDFAQYLGTQSGTNRYRSAQAADPVPELVASVQASWGGRQLVRDVYFPVFMRVGRT
jgi:ubiquinone/menaquinone biosynthesis C-methylase UbiE